jgi:nucleotide-binding universal stress UspA family protein
LNKEIHAFVIDHIPQDLRIQTITKVGSIYEQILETAKEIKSDLIIMTRKGGPRRHYLLGSNANKVINHAETAVLVLE